MSMHIVLAPDSFKGSMSSMEAAHMMAKGIREVLPDALFLWQTEEKGQWMRC